VCVAVVVFVVVVVLVVVVFVAVVVVVVVVVVVCKGRVGRLGKGGACRALLTNAVSHGRAGNCARISSDRVRVNSRDLRQVDLEVAGELEEWRVTVRDLSHCGRALGVARRYLSLQPHHKKINKI
jgi:hypothetical protein